MAKRFENPLDGALWVAQEIGWPVFPLREGSKKPYADEGVTIATTDPAQIRTWYAARRCNFGVSTTDNVVLDVDVKGGAEGMASLDAIARACPIPYTLQVVTPSGGVHIYLSFADAGQGYVWPGIDVRSHGGYVVCPGSIVGGKPYEVSIDAPVAPVPAGIASKLSPPGTVRVAPEERKALGIEIDTDEAIARAKAYLEATPGAPEGARNNTAYRVACAVQDYGVSGVMAGQLLAQYWGVKCEPPIDDWECERVAQNAEASRQTPIGRLHTEADFGDIDAELIEIGIAAPAPDTAKQEAAKTPAKPEDYYQLWRAGFDPREALTPRPWLLTGYLMRDQLTALLAAPGAGKSNLALGTAVAVASGDGRHIGFKVPKREQPGRILFITVEENLDELNRRLWAYCEHHAIDRAKLDGRIWIQRDNTVSLKLMRTNPETRELGITKAFTATRELVKRHNIDLVIFDPLAELHTAEENDNNAVGLVVQHMRQICREARAAGLIAHHTRKAGTAGGTIAGNLDAARGASSLGGAVRFAHTLANPSDEDAALFGFTDAERKRFVRLDDAKASYAARGERCKWFEFVSVAMPDFASDPDEPETTGVLQLVDMAARLDAQIRAYGQAILEAMVGKDGERVEQIKLAAATKAIIASDPAGFGGSALRATKNIRRLFSKPQRVGDFEIGISIEGNNEFVEATLIDEAD